MFRRYLAHLRRVETGEWQFHRLEDHLRRTAELAAEFAAKFGAADWARFAGLLHDLGKFRPPFQWKIRRESGYDPEAPSTAGTNTEHSIVGAIQAERTIGLAGRTVAYAIAGHHAGLADWQNDGPASLNQRLAQDGLLAEALTQQPPDELVNPEPPASLPPAGADPALWIRLIFSCLVDADFLETEAFMAPESAEARGRYPKLSELLSAFREYMDEKRSAAPKTAVNAVRNEVFERCLAMAREKPGLFSLTVPTGGGKTLSSLAFALEHAVRHDLDRIVYVIPYLSIIEQTADVFRDIFGPAVIEHHSSLDPDRETIESRLAAENWDGPIIVTTAVQFYESLFSHRPSRCRKLHNLVRSVVVLDEVQLTPPDYLKPILKVLAQLGGPFGGTVLLCTATQPAFEPMKTLDFTFDGLPGQREIVESPRELHRRLKRVSVQPPLNLDETRSWAELAEWMGEYETFLCIVNSRRDARELYSLLPPGTIHLSAAMCGQHRMDKIAEIRRRLLNEEPLRVVSTQLIECGVDVDFPVVFRALAGLDSIAQAAGRCNREGRLERGRVFVFLPPSPSPPGHLRQAEQAARLILSREPEDLLEPGLFADYFRELFWTKGDGLDREGILKNLAPDSRFRFSFRTASRKFKIIDSSFQTPVLVGYRHGRELIESLRRLGPERWLLRRLQRFVVNAARADVDRLLAAGEIELVHGLAVQVDERLYDDDLGLIADQSAGESPNMVI